MPGVWGLSGLRAGFWGFVLPSWLGLGVYCLVVKEGEKGVWVLGFGGFTV